MNHRYKEEIQTKGIDNMFNKIIAENFPNLESHSTVGGFQNTVQASSEKKYP
jgi:hypothetical protein